MKHRARRNPAPTAAIRAKRYYHATDRDEAGRSILREGVLRPSSPARPRVLLAPVPGRLYLSPRLYTVAVHALGSVAMGGSADMRPGRGRHGWIFAVDAGDLGDVQPDEDQVGEAVEMALMSPEKLAWWMDSQDPFRRSVARRPDLLHDLRRAAERFLTTRQVALVHRGDFTHVSAAGRSLLKHLPDRTKLDLLEMPGANVAHLGPLPIRAAWRLDKHRSREILTDGSNVLEIAERVPLQVPAAARANPGRRVRVVHFGAARPRGDRVPGGADATGLFVYPVVADGQLDDLAVGWPGREPCFFLAPRDALEEVQVFAPGEAGNRYRVVELFVPGHRVRELVPVESFHRDIPRTTDPDFDWRRAAAARPNPRRSRR
jgi:hypothetical protein